MTIFHQGTDAAAFDYVETLFDNGVVQGCNFADKGLIDDEQFVTSSNCYIGKRSD